MLHAEYSIRYTLNEYTADELQLTADIIPGASQWPACKSFVDIPSICPQANTPILVVFIVYNIVHVFQ